MILMTDSPGLVAVIPDSSHQIDAMEHKISKYNKIAGCIRPSEDPPEPGQVYFYNCQFGINRCYFQASVPSPSLLETHWRDNNPFRNVKD